MLRSGTSQVERKDSRSEERLRASTFDPEPLSPEEFYYEGPYLVFTASYHLRRGFCCRSECRHCPFK